MSPVEDPYIAKAFLLSLCFFRKPGFCIQHINSAYLTIDLFCRKDCLGQFAAAVDQPDLLSFLSQCLKLTGFSRIVRDQPQRRFDDPAGRPVILCKADGFQPGLILFQLFKARRV